MWRSWSLTLTSAVWPWSGPLGDLFPGSGELDLISSLLRARRLAGLCLDLELGHSDSPLAALTLRDSMWKARTDEGVETVGRVGKSQGFLELCMHLALNVWDAGERLSAV